MKVKLLVVFGVIGVLSMLVLGVTRAGRWRGHAPGQTLREQAEKQRSVGNYKDAFAIYRRLALDPKDDPKRVGDDLTLGVDCLAKFGRTDEADAFREAVIAVHAGNWRLLSAAAVSYFNGPDHEGTLIAGRFHRAVYRGGRPVGSHERDRARALQLLVQGLDRALADPDRPAAAQYLLVLSRVVMSERDERASWRLQELTSLDRLPEYDHGSSRYGFGGISQVGAPVAAHGTPVYHHVPESFARAASDGERWRWALAQAVRLDPSTLNATRIELAAFLRSEFGTETIAGAGLVGPTDGPPAADGPFALQTLADDETIARLATGIRRFRLPDEFNPIRIYQQVVDEPKTGYGEEALGALASIFENRRQFDRAASYLDKSRFLHGDGNDEKLRHIEQIMLAWGQFQTTKPQPAGRGATLDFRFRNGRRVHFDAFALHQERLLKHVTDFLATHPPQVDDDYLNVDNIGARVVSMNQGEYLGPLVASWDVALDADGRAGRTIPTDRPGQYRISATIDDGRVHDKARQIVVPPESRIVDVKVEPSQPVFKPGQKARVRVKLTAADGKPFVGSTVLAVYDRAVEYISGGSNAPDIRAFFWKWRRHHNPQLESSLDRLSSNLIRSDEPDMMALGLFGAIDDESEFVRAITTHRFGRARLKAGIAGMGGGMMGGMNGMAKSDAAGAMPAPAADATVVEFRDLTESRANLGEPMAPTAAGPGGGAAALVVRTNFADTAFWAPALQTGPDGTAEVEFPLPESLTTWKVKSWAMGPGTRVGQWDAEIVTTKDLLVRIQAPRFFVEKDEVVLSANVHNKLKTRKSVHGALELDGSVLQPMEESARTVDIDAGSERRVDWRVKVAHEGRAIVRMKALTDEESDAARMTFPAYVHGMLRTESFAGAVRPGQPSAWVVVRVPAERDPAQSRLELRYSPTLAGALVDALPYLADYPDGCTEQTLNRFLPTVIAQKVLINLGVDLKAVQAHHTNLNAQELGDARDRAGRWKGYEHHPIFDADEVARMARSGLARLAAMQMADGGWGWLSGSGEQSWAHTTALVVHGLQAARANDLALPKEMLDRGVAWLEGHAVGQVLRLDNAASRLGNYKESADDLDALVLMVLADAGRRNDRLLAYLDRDRTKLSVYGLTLYGLTLERLGDRLRLTVVLQNLSQYVVRDDENGTAYLKLPNRGSWWFWHRSLTETHAFYLKLLARTEPKGDLAPRLVRYMLNSRRHGTYWDSTRDTAFCVEAMAEYLRASGEDRPDMTVAIAVDGRERKRVKIAPDDLFRFDSGFSLDGNDLTTGEHAITITREGRGPVYFNAYLTYFSREDPIPRAGLELKVNRKVYRLVRDDQTVGAAGGRGQVVNQRVEHYRRELLADGATVKSGDLIEVELAIDSKNDYEYLLFEDFKPAGFEPVEVRSGYNGNELGAYVEFRDERVAFFVARMNQGGPSVSYRLRAETPGRFHALPARAQAMYAPELRGNSDEIRLGVQD